MTALDWALIVLGFLAVSVAVAVLVGAAMRGTDRPQPERRDHPANGERRVS